MGGRTLLIVIIVAVVLCCCVTAALVVTGGLAVTLFSSTGSNGPQQVITVEVVPAERATDTRDPRRTLMPGETETPFSEVPQESEDLTGAYETLQTLDEALVPNNDPLELAERLAGLPNIPETYVDPNPPSSVGEERQFWVTDTDTNLNEQVTATLRYVGDHALFWIENGVSYDQNELESLGETFDNQIYEINREFFGSEWNPGIDGDPRLYILYTRGMGSSVAGYFSSADSLHPDAHEYSNAHEMFLLSADNTRLDEDFTYGVLAHEFQHMIHWYTDRNESSWLNEGFSELASFLNGYDVGGFDYLFAMNPDLQLNDWPNDPNATSPHYGAGFLFTLYFLDRFGEDATKAVVASAENGMESIDSVLADLSIVDPLTQQALTADDFFADWAVTNYLLDGNVADGRYTYNNYPFVPQASVEGAITRCPEDVSGTVNQYGADYIRISCDGDYTLNFQGQAQVGILPESPLSGDYAFWSNKGDESDMTLTQTFDFSDVSGPISLTYQTWYDIEADYDYVYLVASDSSGEWQILETPSCTSEDPSGNSFGCGYNGTTDGWIEEEVDLSEFAGEEVTLRFEYVTDAAVNGEGLLLDDIAIPALNYSTDFETDDGGWESAGFVRVQNRLPQTYRVSVVRFGDEVTVESYTLADGDTSLSIPLELGGDVDEAMLVISGTTRYTRQQAQYQFRLE
jgi:hypothetical protein